MPRRSGRAECELDGIGDAVEWAENGGTRVGNPPPYLCYL